MTEATQAAGVITCCVTGRIAGDSDACGDCDPCGAAHSVPQVVRALLAEKDEWRNKFGDAMAALDAKEREVEQWLADYAESVQQRVAQAVNLERFVNRMYAAEDKALAAEARLAQANEALLWANGENGEWPDRKPGEGAFYWRKEMMRRAGFPQYQYDKATRSLTTPRVLSAGDETIADNLVKRLRECAGKENAERRPFCIELMTEAADLIGGQAAALADARRELLDWLYAIAGGRRASIGSPDNTYCPQLSRERVDEAIRALSTQAKEGE